jgi:muconate cycloisomerase
VFAIKITQSGGLRGAQQVAAIGEAAHVGLYGGTMLEGAVGTIASAHLFATFPELAWGTELFGPLLLTEEILRTPLDYRDFALHLPTGPGLGIEIDEEKLAFLQRQSGNGR